MLFYDRGSQTGMIEEEENEKSGSKPVICPKRFGFGRGRIFCRSVGAIRRVRDCYDERKVSASAIICPISSLCDRGADIVVSSVYFRGVDEYIAKFRVTHGCRPLCWNHCQNFLHIIAKS